VLACQRNRLEDKDTRVRLLFFLVLTRRNFHLYDFKTSFGQTIPPQSRGSRNLHQARRSTRPTHKQILAIPLKQFGESIPRAKPRSQLIGGERTNTRNSWAARHDAHMRRHAAPRRCDINHTLWIGVPHYLTTSNIYDTVRSDVGGTARKTPHAACRSRRNGTNVFFRTRDGRTSKNDSTLANFPTTIFSLPHPSPRSFASSSTSLSLSLRDQTGIAPCRDGDNIGD